MFHEGYRTDVTINTDNGGVIYAHASILGVPHQAVRAFIRFLYSSCYEQEEMNEFILPLLVLSHVFVNGLLTMDNVIDIFQLSLLCDAPRLSLFCHRLIVKSFLVISSTEGWKVMKQSHPMLEKELLESVIDADTRKQERLKKLDQRKIYLQLYEAMEALVHICRDENQPPCNFGACKGLETLVRHFAGCKLRVPGGCVHCKRMWQLLELHSRLCGEPNECKVPLCRTFKERLQQQSKKDEVKWKLLVQNILRAKKLSGPSFFRAATDICA
ncbi:hypothetical protein MKW92_000858 [Papaver armeniacum]|nr:hypothetical protein MKW92_000858 [Papaver armeniacum]